MKQEDRTPIDYTDFSLSYAIAILTTGIIAAVSLVYIAIAAF